MITVNMHEAKTRLSELVKAIETGGETVILQRHGKPVAEIHRYQPPGRKRISRLKPRPDLRVTFASDYDPTEPASEDEWPAAFR